jgi:hypothetical protein
MVHKVSVVKLLAVVILFSSSLFQSLSLDEHDLVTSVALEARVSLAFILVSVKAICCQSISGCQSPKEWKLILWKSHDL